MTREEDIKNAVETMRKGGVILYPTDTVWGIMGFMAVVATAFYIYFRHKKMM